MADIETLGILDEIQALVSDKLQVVSYKWLSRNFLVPSNTAKRLLEDFVKKNESQLNVVYSVSGRLKNNPSAYHIKLVSSSQLSEAKEEFGDNCSVQVYSVQACIPKDLSVIWNTEFIQTEELFKQPLNVVNCLRDSRFCGVTNLNVKWNTEGTPVIKTPLFQEKKVEQSNPKPEKGKDVSNGSSHKAQTIQQEVKPVPKKEQAPQLPNKKKTQNDNKTSSGTSGSLASMWGRASSKPKPESAPINTDPIPVSNDAQVLANEMVENVSSDDEDEQMNFKRGSNNGEGNNRKRRVVIDYSDEDDDEELKDVVSLSSPDPPKKQVSVDSKKSLKISEGLESKDLDFDETKEEIVKVKKEKVADVYAKSMLKEGSHEKKMEKVVLNENLSHEKDDVEVEKKDKESDVAKNAVKKRKVMKTRIDDRGREVTEVVWEDEEKEKETKPDNNTKKDSNTTTTTTKPVAAAVPPKKSPAVGNATTKAGNKKAGSKDPKQGNIMSFFKKK